MSIELIKTAHVAASVGDESIDSDAYVDGSIDLAHMSAESVDSDQYVDGSIDAAHLASDSVTTAKIANDAVTAAKIFDLARGSLLIGNASAASAELTVGSDNYVLTVDSSGDIGWEAAGSVSGAQTGITTILNTGVKIGRDSENLVDFATTDNKIILRVNNVNEVELVADALTPTTNDGVALGTTSLGWSDAHLAAQGVINWANGEMTITETNEHLLTVAGGSISATAKELSFDPAVAVNNVSGITASFETGEDMIRGAVAYFKASDSKMWQVDADAAGTMPVVAMAAEDIDVSEEATGLFLLQGFCHDADSFPTWTIGGRIYASTTPGVPTQTAPSGDGDFVQDLGWAVSADAVYFNPSGDVIEHA